MSEHRCTVSERLNNTTYYPPVNGDSAGKPAVSTPLSNRGVSVAKISQGIDWLSLSLPRVSGELTHLKKVLEILHSEHTPVSGGHGYEGGDLAQFGRFTWRKNHRDDSRDYLVVLPGQALEFIRETLKLKIPDVLRSFIVLGWHPTRIDVSIDTTNPKLNPQFLYDWLCVPGAVATHARGKNDVSGATKIGKARDKNGRGMTVYIGSRQSPRFMRVYDKSAEVFEKTGKIIPHTTRFELEIKGESAVIIGKVLAREGEAAIGAIMNGWITFKTRKGRKQAYKRGPARWWAALEGRDKIRPQLKRGLATPEKTMKWQENQWCQAVALTLRHCPERINELAARARIDPVIAARWDAHFESKKAA